VQNVYFTGYYLNCKQTSIATIHLNLQYNRLLLEYNIIHSYQQSSYRRKQALS